MARSGIIGGGFSEAADADCGYDARDGIASGVTRAVWRKVLRLLLGAAADIFAEDGADGVSLLPRLLSAPADCSSG